MVLELRMWLPRLQRGYRGGCGQRELNGDGPGCYSSLFILIGAQPFKHYYTRGVDTHDTNEDYPRVCNIMLTFAHLGLNLTSTATHAAWTQGVDTRRVTHITK